MKIEQMLAKVFGCLFLLWATFDVGAAQAEKVIVVTIDGLRWQEVFEGAEEALISRDGGVPDTNRLRKEFWRDTRESRREALLPFFWKTIGREGQLFGNRKAGSAANVTNGKNFTYPGFNEILTGFADDRINSNAKVQNPNVTVLEWLNDMEGFTNRVAAFANWDVFPFILNADRAGIPIFTGYPEDTLKLATPKSELVRKLFSDITPLWNGMNFDVFFHHAALDYVRERKPRVVWIAYSETDEWAHEGRYDLYLHAANKIDSYIAELWATIQSLPDYRNKTAVIVTTDHGRGTGPVDWKSHGANVKGAEEIWVAAIGPGIRPLGERTDVGEIGQNQVAATIARLLGHDYPSAQPKAGPPIPSLLAN